MIKLKKYFIIINIICGVSQYGIYGKTEKARTRICKLAIKEEMKAYGKPHFAEFFSDIGSPFIYCLLSLKIWREVFIMGNILDYYVKLVEFLGLVLGDQCEIVLQDCRKMSHSIVAIANNHISGRTVGSPLTDYGLKVIADGKWKTEDWAVNYAGHTTDGKTLRCSTFFIKEKGELVGMLCMNYDPSEYIRISNELLKLGGVFSETKGNRDIEKKETTISPVESFYQTIPDMIRAAIKEIFGSLDIDITRLNQEERLSVIGQLNEKGVFQLKGAVSEIAQIFGCSEASIYRYLSKLTKRES